jgi:5-methylcytosine-specific restriction enzyme A
MQNISHVLENMEQPRIAGYLPARNVGANSQGRLRAIISEAVGARAGDRRSRLDAQVSAEQLIGVKAVFSPVSSHVLCFAGRGDPNSTGFFAVPAGAARRASTRPFIIAIGGGRAVRPGFEGRVLNLTRVSQVYGSTKVFVDHQLSCLGCLAGLWPSLFTTFGTSSGTHI